MHFWEDCYITKCWNNSFVHFIWGMWSEQGINCCVILLSLFTLGKMQLWHRIYWQTAEKARRDHHLIKCSQLWLQRQFVFPIWVQELYWSQQSHPLNFKRPAKIKIEHPFVFYICPITDASHRLHMSYSYNISNMNLYSHVISLWLIHFS